MKITPIEVMIIIAIIAIVAAVFLSPQRQRQCMEGQLWEIRQDGFATQVREFGEPVLCKPIAERRQ